VATQTLLGSCRVVRVRPPPGLWVALVRGGRVLEAGYDSDGFGEPKKTQRNKECFFLSRNIKNVGRMILQKNRMILHPLIFT
jgi:hypothetical protein